MEFEFVDLNAGMRSRGITCTGLRVCSVSKGELEVESMERHEFMAKINAGARSKSPSIQPSSEFFDVCDDRRVSSASSEPFTQISEL